MAIETVNVVSGVTFDGIALYSYQRVCARSGSLLSVP